MILRNITALEKTVDTQEHIVHVTKMLMFLNLSDQVCAHVLVGSVRALPYTLFALPTSGPVKCLATCVMISLTAGHHRPPWPQ